MITNDKDKPVIPQLHTAEITRVTSIFSHQAAMMLYKLQTFYVSSLVQLHSKVFTLQDVPFEKSQREMTVALKRCIFDSMFVKPKYV